MEIITGYTGKPHVTSEQDRDVNIGVVGEGSYVLQTGKQLAAEVSSNNEIKIRDGVLMHQGCTASIKKNTYDSLIIINGSQGMKRIDLIVARYEKNQDNGIESLDLKVIQGTPAESNPAAPQHTEGDIQAGDYVADMPMYQVIIEGLNITEVKKMFKVIGSNKDLSNKLGNLGQSAAIGQYGLAWNVGTSYQNAGSKLPAVSNDLYETVSGNDAVIKIKKPGTYLLLASSEFGTNAGVGGVVWNAIVPESGTEIARSCAYIYGGSATTVMSHMLQVESSITIKLCSARSEGSGTIQNKGKDLLQCIKIL